MMDNFASRDPVAAAMHIVAGELGARERATLLSPTELEAMRLSAGGATYLTIAQRAKTEANRLAVISCKKRGGLGAWEKLNADALISAATADALCLRLTSRIGEGPPHDCGSWDEMIAKMAEHIVEARDILEVGPPGVAVESLPPSNDGR